MPNNPGGNPSRRSGDKHRLPPGSTSGRRQSASPEQNERIRRRQKQRAEQKRREAAERYVQNNGAAPTREVRASGTPDDYPQYQPRRSSAAHSPARRHRSSPASSTRRTQIPQYTPPIPEAQRPYAPPTSALQHPDPLYAAPRKKSKTKIIGLFLTAVIVIWVVSLIYAGNSAWNGLPRVNATPATSRPITGSGMNVLLVGSDSRAGLSTAQIRQLHTGNDVGAGGRTDSIMLLHIPDSGKTTVVSIPRDSYVNIPGYGMNKINASYSLGGPQLLVNTVEQATNLRIDHYLEIGFGGFANLVEAVGGVEMCLPEPMQDHKAHIDLPAGCQTLNGANALGYVRARYSDPRGDFGRAERQRKFLGALMNKILSPSNVLWPPRISELGQAAQQGFAVDNRMSRWAAFKTMRAIREHMKGEANSVLVPYSDAGLSTNVGLVVKWDEVAAKELFDALRTDGDTSRFVRNK